MRILYSTTTLQCCYIVFQLDLCVCGGTDMLGVGVGDGSVITILVMGKKTHLTLSLEVVFAIEIFPMFLPAGFFSRLTKMS